LAGLALFLSLGTGHTVYVPDEAARLKDNAEFLLNKRRHTTDRVQKAELLSQAIEKLKQALQIKPEFPVAHNLLGHCYIEKGQWEDARRHLEEALRLRPDYPAALFNRGTLYLRLGAARGGGELVEKAIADLQQALQSELASAFAGDILKALAEAHQLQGDYDRAIARLEEYLKRSPNAPDWDLVERKVRGLQLMKESRERNNGTNNGVTPPAEKP